MCSAEQCNDLNQSACMMAPEPGFRKMLVWSIFRVDSKRLAEAQVHADSALAMPRLESARRRAKAAHLGDLGSLINQFRLRIASIHAGLSPDSLAAQGRLAGPLPLAARYHCISFQVLRPPHGCGCAAAAGAGAACCEAQKRSQPMKV